MVEEVAQQPSRNHDLFLIPGGPTRVGSDDPDHPEEWPVREAALAPYRIGRCAVTNAEYAAFVAATGHTSDAERYGWSFVFGPFLPDDFPPTRGVAAAPWWRQVEGADWAHPEGPQSSVAARADHPVVHVSRLDAEAYAAWRGARLPTEVEWEHAARGGLTGRPFPWGDELEPGGEHRMNVWQGDFPTRDTAADGWSGTCPVNAYEPNGYGLHNTTGNVWEWCAETVSRGGSYLCHASYCRRYRVSARQVQSPDDSTGNLGFRIATDA
ncbi:formylglycine-generating enzyme family protein [Nocardioides lianchengensis]|uniref:Formylglycine-generating enzyme, required for sulfatase activity, contains SUMF1/FGE domain n=1 Tax=Nocardioides lianchengensis TaxID=1045774 RepID=A0A1G6PQB3_9ACTN|nr:formylglycine-generating enzyme family protein [Nocardioides lianchengensis]NYG11935.1 formylglycine-generating enzyme required for sulfatase activity [Nocardioides lianchengensis]SDC82161.1 Formylglycine-generating enzyme, required for sulfatase activity, contains SUMF1/FGE domain [Nocardioides lianchengensis]